MVRPPLCGQKAQWLARLEEAGAFAPAFELCELLFAATGLTRAQQLARENSPLTQQESAAAEELVCRRCAGEPLQYILGEWEFYGLPFFVGEGVLIPRADTETLVDAALTLLGKTTAPRIADLCSGSGCVAIALAKRLPAAHVTAVELSEAAMDYLRRNVRRNAAENVTPLLCDALALPDTLAELDLIVSNPPYIPTGELAALAEEVRREPMLALDGRADGLYFYRALAESASARLRAGGWLAFECGDTQASAVRDILAQNGLEQLHTRQDIEGFERVVYGCKAKI